MLVVADSSPIIVLIEIGHIDILPRLFGQVVIPPEVSAELLQNNRPQIVRDFMASRPAWLIERSPSTVEAIPSLHAGEIAAICLAREVKADLLLIDETSGRKAAAERHIPFTGTIGVLEFAANRGFLDLEDAFTRIKNTNFWISDRLLDERLKRSRTGRNI
jgi:predicted nucleic acid-binding protein